MTKLMRGLAMIAALLTAGCWWPPASAESKPGKKAGILHVYGNADTKLFSEDGIKRAESAMHSAQFEGGMMLTVDTYPKIPDDMKAEAIKEEEKWRGSSTTGPRSGRAMTSRKGMYVLICRSPGYVAVIASRHYAGTRFQR